MNKWQWRGIVGVFFVLSLVVVLSAGMAMARGPVEEICDNGKDDDGDKAIDCKDSDCATNPACVKEEPRGLCHNIGGPDGLGANCDGLVDSNGHECEALADAGLIAAFVAAQVECGLRTNCAPDNIYAGIFVPHSDNAITAHENHGDGPALVLLPERVHDTQPHVSANIDCFGVRVFPQPPEPGN